MDENVVRRDARLAGVIEFTPHDASGRDVEVGLLIDQARALAAELERDGRQVLCGRLHDDTADGAITGIKDVIELLR